MPEALVPRSGTDRQQSMRSTRRLGDRTEISRAITSEKDMTGQEILYRETKCIEFNCTIVISSELTNRNKIFDDIRSD
uniref:Uncharacterized protein n=1 Tax=Tanacetum cinerariifolium TaxID=118510 RepID=A0A699KN36_TANCI|nr:hypothetical protein [Tanacetum cinerariifolium]